MIYKLTVELQSSHKNVEEIVMANDHEMYRMTNLGDPSEAEGIGVQTLLYYKARSHHCSVLLSLQLAQDVMCFIGQGEVHDVGIHQHTGPCLVCHLSVTTGETMVYRL